MVRYKKELNAGEISHCRSTAKPLDSKDIQYRLAYLSGYYETLAPRYAKDLAKKLDEWQKRYLEQLARDMSVVKDDTAAIRSGMVTQEQFRRLEKKIDDLHRVQVDGKMTADLEDLPPRAAQKQIRAARAKCVNDNEANRDRLEQERLEKKEARAKRVLLAAENEEARMEVATRFQRELMVDVKFCGARLKSGACCRMRVQHEGARCSRHTEAPQVAVAPSVPGAAAAAATPAAAASPVPPAHTGDAVPTPKRQRHCQYTCGASSSSSGRPCRNPVAFQGAKCAKHRA